MARLIGGNRNEQSLAFQGISSVMCNDNGKSFLPKCSAKLGAGGLSRPIAFSAVMRQICHSKVLDAKITAA